MLLVLLSPMSQISIFQNILCMTVMLYIIGIGKLKRYILTDKFLLMNNYKIICIAQIYNDLEKGNLKRFVRYVIPLCDSLIVYDDGSTDGSAEYIKKKTPFCIKGKKNDFENEMFHKQLLLEKAKKLGADFVFYLDADEVLTASNKND